MNQEQAQELIAVMDDARSGLQAELSMRRDLNFNPDHPENDYWSQENLENAISQLEEGQEMIQEEMNA